MSFGKLPFGNFPFGRHDYVRATQHVPTVFAQQDEAAGGMFQGFLDVSRGSFDFILNKIRTLDKLRHPLLVPSRYTEVESISVLSFETISDADSEGWGPHVQLTCDSQPIAIGAGWRIQTADAQFVVMRVRREEKRVDIIGDLSPGLGTWETFAPEQLTTMYRDSGIPADQYMDEGMIRGELHNAPNYLLLKGSNTGYVARGLAAGFRVTVFPLWEYNPDIFGDYVGSDSLQYVDREGNLHFLTYVPPTWPKIDQVRADAFPTGLRCEDLTLNERSESITITAVSSANSLHTLTLNARVHKIGSASGGRWTMTQGGSSWVIEQVVSDTSLTVYGPTAPGVGSATLTYACIANETCEYCKTHFIKITVQPLDELSASGGADGNAFGRLMAKLTKMIPAHVEVVAFGQVFETSLGNLVTSEIT